MNRETRKVCFMVLRCDREDEASLRELELVREGLRDLESWDIEKIKFLTS